MNNFIKKWSYPMECDFGRFVHPLAFRLAVYSATINIATFIVAFFLQFFGTDIGDMGRALGDGHQAFQITIMVIGFGVQALNGFKK